MIQFLPATPVAAPLVVSAFLAAVNQHINRRLADVIAIAAAVYCVCVSLVLVVESAHAPIVYWMGGWTPRGSVAIGISFTIDPIGSGLAAFASFLVLIALVFA
ncbi:MAG: NADH-quinone oxidoreductase subunit E, partial [Candidatus Angelobacter sp.]